MFDGHWRDTVDRGTGPVGAKLQKMGVTADVLTATGLISATATAVAVGSGHLDVAIFLLALTGLHDLLDGPVAKAAGTASVRGAYFDSVTDRVADALLFGGVAWYIGSHRGAHLVLLPFAILAASSLISYQRAKAESLGLSAKGGLMERAERMVLLGIGLITAATLVPVLWVLLVLTSVTAAGRFLKVWRLASESRIATLAEAAAGAALADAAAGAALADALPVDGRWRAWREQSSGVTRSWRISRTADEHPRHRGTRRRRPAETRARHRARRRGESSDRRFLARWGRDGDTPRAPWRSIRDGERTGWSVSDRRRS